MRRVVVTGGAGTAGPGSGRWEILKAGVGVVEYDLGNFLATGIRELLMQQDVSVSV